MTQRAAMAETRQRRHRFQDICLELAYFKLDNSHL
jgi:hypothetical protein